MLGNKLIIFVTILINTLLLQYATGAKILSVGFMTTKSHKIVFDLLLNNLADRGHEVTILSPVPSRSNRTNPKEILTFDYAEEWANKKGVPDIFEMKMRGESINPFKMVDVFEDLCRRTYALPQVREVMAQKFDLVFFEPFMNECAGGFVHKLNTTVILLSPFATPAELVRQLGGPAPPSFIPNMFSSLDNNMNFLERIQNFVMEVLIGLMQKLYFTPNMVALYREALNDSTIPSIGEILQNSSLTLSNSHISLNGARPLMPDIIEVGGMHMRQAKPLPKDLEDFIQTSGEHGFIFFSMGSILESSKLPLSHRNALLDAFSRLKQNVIWKWESDDIPDKPKNVKLIKWAPQQDILGHPKCKAFITHGGLGGTTEAIYHGTPFIGIPMFGDQNTNIEKFSRAGIAMGLEFNELSADSIVEAVEHIITEPKYQQNVKQISKIFRDQRDNPLERAVFWTEYVLRHNGAIHLRSPARELNFFQYHSLDVMGTILLAIFLVGALIYLLLCKLCSYCRTGFSSTISSNDKKRN